MTEIPGVRGRAALKNSRVRCAQTAKTAVDCAEQLPPAGQRAEEFPPRPWGRDALKNSRGIRNGWCRAPPGPLRRTRRAGGQ